MTQRKARKPRIGDHVFPDCVVGPHGGRLTGEFVVVAVQTRGGAEIAPIDGGEPCGVSAFRLKDASGESYSEEGWAS